MKPLKGRMKRILVGVFFICAFGRDVAAQSANTFHIFPQIADGRFGDGSYFQSSFLVTNVAGAATNCTISLYGLPSNRFAGPTSFSIPAGSINVISTNGNQAPLASGYTTLTCDQPVTALLAYSLMTPNGSVASAAAVFSSAPTTGAQLILSNRMRLALAIANDTDGNGEYLLSASTASGQSLGSTTITVPARANLARFVDELMRLPSNFVGFVKVTSSSSRFSVIGLNFIDSAFLTQPATTFDATPPVDVTGTWSGDGSISGQPAQITLTLTQNGTKLTGTIAASFKGRVGVFSGSISGTIGNTDPVLQTTTLTFNTVISQVGDNSASPFCASGSATVFASTNPIPAGTFFVGSFGGAALCTPIFPGTSFTVTKQ